jgi:hypothetical protein
VGLGMSLVWSATDLSVFILFFSNGAHTDSASHFFKSANRSLHCRAHQAVAALVLPSKQQRRDHLVTRKANAAPTSTIQT